MTTKKMMFVKGLIFITVFLIVSAIILLARAFIIKWAYNEVVPTMMSGGKITMIDAVALILLVGTLFLPMAGYRGGGGGRKME